MRLREFRNPEKAAALAGRIRSIAEEDVRLMEVCGTHTMEIGRHGIRSMLPETVKLISGPGCPVCVTPEKEIDRAIMIAREYDVIVTTFGDMFRVPGGLGSLEEAKGKGADIRIVYSPFNALEAARKEKPRPVLFLGVGFETTAPTIAATVLLARKEGLTNFFILSLGKLVPPALKAILELGKARVDGFILPGHVCTISGSKPYEFIARDFGRPCVVTGFEPVDILMGVYLLIEMISGNDPRVEIQYKRAVKREGNRKALEAMEEVFRPCDSEWRAIGVIKESGLGLREEFREMDGMERFPVDVPEPGEHPGCLCSDILMGLSLPTDCPLFGNECTPRAPVGPCMVSSEGTCAAYYKYGGR